MKYKKKPVVIEAVQLRWDTWSEMCDHATVGELSKGFPMGTDKDPETGEALENGGPGLLIPTLEGVMLGRPGDWIIKGVNGELYPCKPDIFEKTYELADVNSKEENL